MANQASPATSSSSSLLLDEIILAHSLTTPAKTAIIFNEQELSYQGLANRVYALAEELLEAGVSAEDFVVVLLPPCLDVSVALLAIHHIGAIYAPLDLEHPDAQLKAKIEDLKPACIVSVNASQPRVSQWSTKLIALEALMVSDGILSPVNSKTRDLNAPACIFFTSGSSGEAKGVLGSAKAMRDAILAPAHFLGFNASDTLNSIARYAWSISMLELLAPLVMGGTSLMLDRALALDLNELSKSVKRCSAFHCPPALLRKLAEHIEQDYHPADYPANLRLVWYGGDVFAPHHIDKLQQIFPEAQIGTAYGSTEIFGLSHCHLYQRQSKVENVLIGKPVAGFSQLILDQQQQPLLSPGEGEMYLSGPCVALEYRNNPKLSEEKFVHIEGKRYFATGDFVYLDDNADLRFLQRRDTQVKIRGIRIELGEIEFHLNSLHLVKEAIVLAVDNQNHTKELRAYIVTHQTALTNIEDIRSALADKIPDYMLPTQFYSLDALPVTENFKIDKKALKAYQPQVTKAAITDEVASKIADIWQAATRQAPDSIDAHFFKSGGDSLSAVQVAASLSREFKITFEVAEVYRNPALFSQVEKVKEDIAKLATLTNSDDRVVTDSFATLAQTGLFFRELMESKGESITCTRYIRRDQGFVDEHIQLAIVKLVERFSSLRTHLKLEKPKIRLLLKDSVACDKVLIRRQVEKASADNAGLINKTSHKFNLQQDPLIFAVVSEMPDGSEILQLTAHHIAADDNSMGRLAHDFIEYYDAQINHREATLPEVSLTYDEFANEQQSRLNSDYYVDAARKVANELSSPLAYCKNQPLLNLDHYSDKKIFSVTERVVDNSTSISFTHYIAALSWALNKQFGRESFVFCGHVALRRDSATQPRVGMFVNLVPVITGINPEHCEQEHAQRTQKDFDAAMSRSDIPFELIQASTPELKALKKFPFDAYINELRFDNTYPDGYEDIMAQRPFTTDAKELSMSIIRHLKTEDIKLEGPNIDAASAAAQSIITYMSAYLRNIAH